jgi:hypothetical protein
MATGLSYIFITQFFLDVAGMVTWQAWAFGGFLEVCLVAAGYQARERILAGADAGVLLTLTWVFSGTSAALSASHEIVQRTADGMLVLDLNSGAPITMIVRAAAPLAAAVMWHLLLVGEKHMTSGKSPRHRRYTRLMHTYMLAREQWRDIADPEDERAAQAREAMLAARSKVFRTVPVAEYESFLEEWLAALDADYRGSARVDRMSEIRKPTPARKAPPRPEATRRQATTPVPDSGIPDHVAVETGNMRQPAQAAAPTPVAGKPVDLDKEARDLMIRELDQGGRHTQAEIAAQVGVSDRTVRNVLAAAKASARM